MAHICTDGCCARFAEGRQSALNFALLLVAYILYLLVGAGVFSAIELPYDRELRRELQSARREFLGNNTCVSDARLEELLSRALEANSYGVSVLGNSTRRNWDFVSALFFTSTVLTTTGYGHTAPLSNEGKAFCIVYSLAGIPVTLLFLSAVVQRIMVLATHRPLSYLQYRCAVPRATLAAAHAACLAALIALCFLVVPAWIFAGLERDWNFLESLYFCFISLTTIGLGDYVPGEDQSDDANPHPQLYRFTITAYLLLGLVFVLVAMDTCWELPQLKRVRRRFYCDDVRELDAETARIVGRDHASEQLTEPSDRGADQLPAIASVSEQAASLRRDGAAATGSAAKKKH
ncbi:potassium channel subfamily K member 1-like [Betta splendens]|uniref:Potassium channel subfamily K member n=1 Tax=Betta splendens TaxID=158456 RepID=A0A6P7L7Y8_BETSP|nr:potassium channel subfamily K member 1-like [Betta splendens]